MGVDSKLFVTTKSETMLELMPKLIKDLNEWQRLELDTYLSKNGFDNRLQFIYRKHKDGLKDYSNGIKSIDTYDFRSFNINFTINDENRSLFVTHSCSNDYSDVFKGDKIIFSIGCWGMNDEIMKIIANSVKCFGDVYYVFNDCDGDFKKIN